VAIVGLDASKHHPQPGLQDLRRKTFAEFRRAVIKFLRHEVPKHWSRFCDRITDNFGVIRREDFRVIA